MSCGSLIKCLFLAGVDNNIELKGSEIDSYKIIKNIQLFYSDINRLRLKLKKMKDFDSKYQKAFENEKIIKLGKISGDQLRKNRKFSFSNVEANESGGN